MGKPKDDGFVVPEPETEVPVVETPEAPVEAPVSEEPLPE